MVKGNYVFYYSCTQTLQDAQCALGSAWKMDAEAARRKARAMKAEALGMQGPQIIFYE